MCITGPAAGQGITDRDAASLESSLGRTGLGRGMALLHQAPFSCLKTLPLRRCRELGCDAFPRCRRHISLLPAACSGGETALKKSRGK